MKAASILRHIWVGGLFCLLFLAATSVAYANALNNGTTATVERTAEQELLVEQTEPPKKKGDISAAKDSKVSTKQAEVKKESPTSGFFSFSFLYYLFYKMNVAESTNNALRSSLNSLISRLID